MVSNESRTYVRSESVVFLKTQEAFGGLSNMCAGFPLKINGVRILTSEALYQACRFPDHPNIQDLILNDKSPMGAKMVAKKYRAQTRLDWDDVRVEIMWWCLKIKLVQNWKSFGELLLAPADKPIVEQSGKDPFWGALVTGDDTLKGVNVLGQLLMKLREEFKSDRRDQLLIVKPPEVDNFMLSGQVIGEVRAFNLEKKAFCIRKVPY